MPLNQDPQQFTGNSSDQDTTMGGMGEPRGQASSSSPQKGDTLARNSTGDNPRDDDLSRGGGANRVEHPPYNDGDEDEDDEDEDEDDEDDENDDDPFGAYGGPGDHDSGLSSTLRALTGIMTGLSSRLRELLGGLRSDDSSVQVIALQELSEIFLVSNEDNLSGHFSPDAFVKELVQLMGKEESPEIMLLACRCLANLMEALPASIANVVYGNAVPVLCQKLLEISFIDLAEQALSTLEKISTEYPSSIVREGGLTACLSYLDFFATSTQRTAVTTAANCCRNIPDDSFPIVKDIVPTLLNVLNSNDQRVVEQASLCVSGIVESFKYHPAKLEELISVDLLRAILRLLAPGTTNLIGPNIHTQFLRVLAFTARASARLSSELFKLNVVETLYQILTGVSPPTGTEDVASKLDSVIIMQALIHRPREQIVEALNVICELLPDLPRNVGIAVGDFMELHDAIEPIAPSSLGNRCDPGPNNRRLELLEDCKDQVRRFVLIIFPTLTDAFSSTINLSVRQKVLTAQIKMLSNLNQNLLAEALAPVPYASFLASILSQQDHPSLVILGLQATELLLTRLGSVYQYQLYREGVILEIQKLAVDDSQSGTKEDSKFKNTSRRLSLPDAGDSSTPSSDHESEDNNNEDEEEAEDEGEGAAHEHRSSGGDEEDVDNELNASDVSPASSRGSSMSLDATSLPYVSNIQLMKSRIITIAKKFLEVHEKDGHGQIMRTQTTQILQTLSQLAEELEAFYLARTSKPLSPETGRTLFSKLSNYFDTDILESITSAELLASGIVRVLLAIFSNPDESLAHSAQASFLEVFMNPAVKSKPGIGVTESQATPFGVLIHKLQDLLSRSEHFEVITVHQNSFDGNRSSPASMLGKQIKLRLVADDELSIPRSYRNIMVSIHAIATFKSLDDYLRPRISLAERPRISRRDGLSRALAAIANSSISQNFAAGAGLTGQPPSLTGSTTQPPLPLTSGSSSRFSGGANSKLSSHLGEIANSQPAGPSTDKGSLRRSSRLFRPSAEIPNPSTRPPDEDKAPQPTLECADEKQLTDDDDNDEAGDSTALDAIVGALGEDMEGRGDPDPSAVNLEVASGNIITRKEDGTRVPTPTGSRFKDYGSYKHSSPAASHSSSRQPSYSSILQPAPQDWYIEFTLDDKVIPNETTIYRAVHMSTSSSGDYNNKNIWSSTHPIKFRRVSGQPPAESRPTNFNIETDGEVENGISASLAKHPITASILRLLNILHDLNANIEDVLIENRNSMIGLRVEQLSQFVNTKLTAKLNRQLEEPLIVASSCLPSWSEDLARLYPFLFPFETRHLFLQSTSFGYARSMARWQNAQSTDDNRRDRSNERPFLGRLQRQKVRISRLKILESALKVMELYGASQSILEVEYFEEVGTGLGPTLEFYSTVSKEFSKKKLKLWREVDSAGSDEFVMGQMGLFPRPLSPEEATPNGERILHLFKALGKFVARSMIDSRIIDLHFNPIFFRIGDTSLTGVKPSLGAVKIVDPGLARSLKTIKKFVLAKKEVDENPNLTPAQKVADTEAIMIDNARLEDFCLDFTLPGYPEIELEEHGSLKRVTIENVDTYLEKVIDMTLGIGVKRQIDAFRTGFSQVFPYTALRAFTPDELVSLFGRVEEDWSLESEYLHMLDNTETRITDMGYLALMDSIKADHGYNMDSRSVKNLLQAMSELDLKQRRDFLQFTTGSPKLPIGGKFLTYQPVLLILNRRLTVYQVSKA